MNTFSNTYASQIKKQLGLKALVSLRAKMFCPTPCGMGLQFLIEGSKKCRLIHVVYEAPGVYRVTFGNWKGFFNGLEFQTFEGVKPGCLPALIERQTGIDLSRPEPTLV